MTEPSRETEYRWYLAGCNRLDRTPLSKEEFCTRWQQFEDYAETLKTAERDGKLLDLDPKWRANMEREIQNDPVTKAVLIGQAEQESNSYGRKAG